MVASNNKAKVKKKQNTPHNRQPNPTREEIREACLKMQEEWDEREFEKRAGMKPKEWSVPHSALEMDPQSQTN